MTAFKGLGTYGNGAGVVTPSDHKQDDAGLVVKQSGNLIRPGLFWGGTATIVTGTAGMAYSVAAYTCATTRGATSGAVFGGNDGAFSVTTTAAPGSNSRYDVVYHWQREYSLDGVDSNPVIGVIQGTAAASPTVPSLAAFPGAIALATILVPAGVTATNTGTTITQTAPFTAMAGGTLVFRTTTERDASTVVPFTKGFVLADNSEHVYVSGWTRLGDVFKTGETAAIKGTNATVGAPKIRQEFSTVPTTTTSGVIVINFPTAFPNGVTMFIVTPGDNVDNPGAIVPIAANGTLAYIYAQVYTPAGVLLASGLPVRVNVLAVGW